MLDRLTSTLVHFGVFPLEGLQMKSEHILLPYPIRDKNDVIQMRVDLTFRHPCDVMKGGVVTLYRKC